MANGILYLLKNPKRAQRMGKNARKYVVNYASWKGVVNEVLDIYDSMMNKRLK